METSSDAAMVRAALVPRWIRVFSALFACFLVVVPVVQVWNLFSPLELLVAGFGFSYHGPVDAPQSLALQGVLVVAGIAGAGLLLGRIWGLPLALAVGFLSLGLSCFGMGFAWARGSAYFEFAPLFQVPFIIAMCQRIEAWRSAAIVVSP